MSLTNTGTATYPTVVKAQLKALPSGTVVPIQFNPTSLVYTVESSAPQQSRDNKRRQHVDKHSAKLTMDLQFDTTDSGVDVRQFTNPVAAFMESSASANKKGSGTSSTTPPAPPVLSFEWGAYQFQGFMESFKETIDFFSADGIPLRALVSIGLARQDEVFSATPGSTNTAGSLSPTSSSLVPTSSSGNPTTAATQGGDPNAGRALASANGLASTRFTAGASLEVGAGIQLNGPVAFVASASAGAGIGISGGIGVGISAGAGVGISAGGGIGISAGAAAGVGIGIGGGASAGFGIGGSAGAGLGIGASAGASAGAGFGIGASAGAGIGLGGVAAAGAGFGVSAGASAGAGFAIGGAAVATAGITASTGAGSQVTLAAGGGALFGSRASAGVPATAGAFAGLEVGRATISTTAQLDPLRMLPATVGTDVAVGANASFGLGGMALSPPGFSANVGASFSYEDSLTFDSD